MAGHGSIPTALRPTVKAALDTFRVDGGPWKVPSDSSQVHLRRAISAKHGGDATKTTRDFNALKALFGSNMVLDTANNLPAGTYFYGSSTVSKWPDFSTHPCRNTAGLRFVLHVCCGPRAGRYMTPGSLSGEQPGGVRRSPEAT